MEKLSYLVDKKSVVLQPIKKGKTKVSGLPLRYHFKKGDSFNTLRIGRTTYIIHDFTQNEDGSVSFTINGEACRVEKEAVQI